MLKRTGWLVLSMLILLFAFAPAGAQQKDPRVSSPAAPLPPLSMGESSSKAPGESPGEVPAATTTATSDKPPLSSLTDWGLGSLGGGRSSLVPTLAYTSAADSNAQGAGGGYNWHAFGALRGSVTLNKIWSRAQFKTDYSTGGTIFSTTSRLRAAYHRFNATQTFKARRWTFLIGDVFSRSPEASLGVAGIGLITDIDAGHGGFAGSQNGNLSPSLLPNQTILNPRGSRISNLTATEIQYAVSRRSNVTFASTYGFVHYGLDTLRNSQDWGFRTGYTYDMRPGDSIGVTYAYNVFRNSGSAQRADSQSIQLAYGRRITGRMSLQLGAGPEISSFKDPVNPTGSDRRESWSFRGSLNYQFPLLTANLAYDRHVAGGSGLFLGAESDVVHLMLNRPLTRQWIGYAQMAYAHNRDLVALINGNVARMFHSYQSYLGVRRTLGRYCSMSLSYGLQLQSGDGAACVGPECRHALRRHSVQLNLSWTGRPIHLD